MVTEKPLVTLWSQAAFEACASEIDTAQKLVLKEVGDLTACLDQDDGWFFHVITTPNGQILRCDAEPGPTGCRVHVRLAEYDGSYPKPLETPANEKFADFWEIKANWRP